MTSEAGIICRKCGKKADRVLEVSAPMGLPETEEIDFVDAPVIVIPSEQKNFGVKETAELDATP